MLQMSMFLEANTVLAFVVGQRGGTGFRNGAGYNSSASGGGGGSFVFDASTMQPIIVAGGGGGVNPLVSSTIYPGCDANTTGALVCSLKCR